MANVRRSPRIVVIVLCCLFVFVTSAQAVNPQTFLEMSPDDQILYTKGVLDTLTALAAENLIPKEAAVCSRSLNYGELISEVNSYLYKALASEERAVKDAVKITPLSVWIVRNYWEKCEGRER